MASLPISGPTQPTAGPASTATPPLGPPPPRAAIQPVNGESAAAANAPPPAIQAADQLLGQLVDTMKRLAGVIQLVDPTLLVHLGTMANAGKAIQEGLQRSVASSQGIPEAPPQPQPAEPNP